MIGINIHAPDNSATDLPAAKITTAVLHTATNTLVVTYKDANGATQNVSVGSPESTDLFNALVAIKAGTYSTTT